MFGMAADISVRHFSISDLSIQAKQVGFRGIGVYKNFLHVDVREYPEHWEG